NNNCIYYSLIFKIRVIIDEIFFSLISFFIKSRNGEYSCRAFSFDMHEKKSQKPGPYMNKGALFNHAMFKKKQIGRIVSDTNGTRSLTRTLSPFDLVMLGIGGIIG